MQWLARFSQLQGWPEAYSQVHCANRAAAPHCHDFAVFRSEYSYLEHQSSEEHLNQCHKLFTAYTGGCGGVGEWCAQVPVAHLTGAKFFLLIAPPPPPPRPQAGQL